MIARSLLLAAGKPGTYSDPAGTGTEAVRVILNDAPGETRREAGEEILTDAAIAVLPVSAEPEEGGLLTVAGSGSRVAGLLDCEVARVSGSTVDVYDLSRGITGPGSESVVLDGRTIRASVSRKSDSIAQDDQGNEILIRTDRVAIRASDLGTAGQGSLVVFDGHQHLVSAVRPTGAGILILIC
jgi:hypothetical protein